MFWDIICALATLWALYMIWMIIFGVASLAFIAYRAGHEAEKRVIRARERSVALMRRDDVARTAKRSGPVFYRAITATRPDARGALATSWAKRSSKRSLTTLPRTGPRLLPNVG